jgi:metal-responsive CopG/Arc/MetJ family transcriptional regulator
MDSVPRCDCGNIHGADRKDEYCKDCLSYCSHRLEDKIESILWARVPDEVSGFVNPMVWTMLTKFFKKGGFDIIQWLTNTNYTSNSREPSEAKLILAMGIKRGYNNFINNFDQILELMLQIPTYKKKQNKDELVGFIQMFRDKIFSRYLKHQLQNLIEVINEVVVTSLNTHCQDQFCFRRFTTVRRIVGISQPLNNVKATFLEELGEHSPNHWIDKTRYFIWYSCPQDGFNFVFKSVRTITQTIFTVFVFSISSVDVAAVTSWNAIHNVTVVLG